MEQSGQSGKTVPTYSTDPEVDLPTIVPGSELWTLASMDSIAMERDCRRTTKEGRLVRVSERLSIAHDGAIAIPGVVYIS